MLPLLESTPVKGATKHVDVTSRTVAAAWPALRACSRALEYLVFNVIDISEFVRATTKISNGH